jgi:geranylgeranyl pyrophosphate synthase
LELARLPADLDSAVRAQFSAASGPASLFGLLTAHSYFSGGGVDSDDAMPAAAAMEFLVAAASVLDDLQDGDEVSGIDQTLEGSGAELVALLMSLSQSAMGALDGSAIPSERIVAAHSLLAKFELRALAGQHESNAMDLGAGPSLSDATNSVEAKSGSFGRLAAELGATLASSDEDLIEAHGTFGQHLAVIDQLQNDVAGIWPGEETSTDIELGRGTPPLIFALEVPSGVSEAADEVKRALKETGGSDSVRDEARVREALFKSGAVHYSWIVAAVHRAKAASIARNIERENPESRLADLLAA